jgi:hypothetical protein
MGEKSCLIAAGLFSFSDPFPKPDLSANGQSHAFPKKERLILNLLSMNVLY